MCYNDFWIFVNIEEIDPIVTQKKDTLALLSDTRTLTLVRRLLGGYTKPYRFHIAMGVLCMVLVAVTTALLAKEMQPIIDDVFFKKDLGMLYMAAAQVFLIFFVKGAATYGESVVMGYAGQSIMADIQKVLFRKVINADFAFMQNTNSSQLVSRFILDIPMLDNAVTGTITSIVKDTLTVLFLAAVMFYQDWLLSCIAIIVFPVAILPVSRIGKKMRRASGDIQAGWATLTTLINQAIQGIRLIKGYNLEKHETQRAEQTISDVLKLTIKGIKTKSIVHPVMEVLGGIAIVVVIIYGGYRVIEGVQTAGAFFSFVTALIMAYEPVKNLAKLNNNLQEALAALIRVFQVLDKTPEISEPANAKTLTLSDARIDFKDLSFSYIPGVPVLDKINLTVKPGQKVALVGPSGAGKSTLLNLILRFYDPTNGSIFIDGQDITKASFSSLRTSIALVSQEVVLFDDTVRRNILFGDQTASDEAVEKAASDAAAHEFIQELPNGYDTHIGEHGTTLSGGQRQRISIARAMLKNAPILLLDEATSALDSESERKIQEALKTLMEGRTSITIAHRLSTVVDADMIYVMDQGAIVAEGTHQQLLKTSSLYQMLCKGQFFTPKPKKKAA